MSLFAALSVLTAMFVGSFLDEVTACAGIKIIDAPPAYKDQREIWDQEHAMRLVNLLRRIGIEEFKEIVAGIEVTQNYKMKPNKIMNVLKGARIFQSSESAGTLQRFEENFGTNETDYDDKILYIENPVEARLPGHRISIRLLRKIMMARSLAANIPFTTTSEATTTPQEGKNDADTKGPSTESNNHVTYQTENTAGNAEDKTDDKGRDNDQEAGQAGDKDGNSADDKSPSKAEDKGGEKADDKGAGKVNDKIVAKADDKAAGNVDDKAAGKADDKGAGKVDDKTVAKADDNAVGNADDKAAGKADDNGAGKVDDKTVAKADDKAAGNADDKAAGKADDKGGDHTENKA